MRRCLRCLAQLGVGRLNKIDFSVAEGNSCHKLCSGTGQAIRRFHYGMLDRPVRRPNELSVAAICVARHSNLLSASQIGCYCLPHWHWASKKFQEERPADPKRSSRLQYHLAIHTQSKACLHKGARLCARRALAVAFEHFCSGSSGDRS